MLIPMVLVFILISILIAFAIGANDETFSTVYGSKFLSMKEVLILATIFAIMGAVLLGRAVSETVGNNILYIEITPEVVITILISTAIWLIISSALKLPISTTHATIGAIIGIGIYLGGNNGINWLIILEMSLWWIFSPIIGFVVTYVVYKLIHKTIINKLNGFEDFERTERIFAYILLGSICLTAFSRAGNDCSNAIGIVVGLGTVNVDLILFIAGISFASGIIILGRGVIKNLSQITELHPSTAFAAEVPTAIILFVGTLRGIPLSGSHMLVASLLGLAKARRAPVKKGIWKIVLVWLLTFPMAALLSIILYNVFFLFI
ncbi:MAG: inorganic phosphate transporter [Promethearchaeota archaeon]|nr:MAG: inorganic phosphate transporter [Candidatus Lokiarchaeota archaeon]